VGHDTSIHGMSHSVNTPHILAHLPTDDEIRAALRNMQPYMSLRDFDKLPGGPSYRTVYRQLEADPPAMVGNTRGVLTELLADIEYTDPTGNPVEAARRLRRLIATRAAQVARAEQEIDAQRGQGGDARKKRQK
jgi:hypothetical protein